MENGHDKQEVLLTSIILLKQKSSNNRITITMLGKSFKKHF